MKLSVYRSILTAVALCLAWAGGAAGEGFQGLPVVEISFSPPAQPVAPARLEKLISLRVGARLSLDDVRRSIEAMFATGRYADIQVDAVRLRDGVKVTFITTETWFIGPVKVLGVKPPPSQGLLVNAAKLELGDLYTREKLEAAKQSLLKLLADNGLRHAAVEAETFGRSDTQQIEIVLRVRPGERARFGQIRLSGKPDQTADRLRRITGWRPHRRFTQPAVQRGLDRLGRHYQKTGRLQATVRVAGQDFVPNSNRVDLNVEIQPGPRVEVAVSGPKLSRSQLRHYIPIYEEGTIDRDLLIEGARNLRDYFQTQGYFDVKVDYAEYPEENGQILVEFQVVLGKGHDFVKLEITGNRFFDRPTIRERMYLQPRSWQLRRGRFSQGLLRSDMGAIEELYRSNGFLAVKVDSRLEDDYRGRQGDVAVFLSIAEGPQTLVSQLQISGNRAIPTDVLIGRVSSIEGQPFSELNVASDRGQILDLYFSKGFPDATLEWRYTPAPEPHRVQLEYVIQEGEQQYVSHVITEGYERTRPGVIQRQIQIFPGEPLSQAAMIETQRRLYDLGIFSQVDMALQNPEGKEEYRNVVFQLDEARPWTVAVGGGAEIARFGGSDTSLSSPAGATGFSPRVSLEVNRLNFLGRAATLSFRSRVSTLEQRALLSLQAPQWRGRDRLTLTFTSLYDKSRNVRTFSATRLEGALQLQQKISKPSTVFYRYSYRRVSVDSRTLNIDPGLIPLLSQPVRVGLLAASFSQDRRDDPLDAKRGIYNTIDLGVASYYTGSEATFGRLLVQDATYHRLSRRVVLARSTQIGAMEPFGRLRRVETPVPGGGTLVRFTREIPLPERFFSGGSNSHRGFPVNQAGPRDLLTGFPLGGNVLLVNSVELRFPVKGENIGGVLFHDAGNVYSKISNVSFRSRQRDPKDFDYMVHAVGFGVRYRTPIGPIRLDFAYSINPPRFRGFKGTRDQLLKCGTTTDSVRACIPTDRRISHFQFQFSLGQTF